MKDLVLWNKTTRILHWAIAIPVAMNFFIDGGDLPHKILGYLALAALFLRIGWGFKSPDQANFKNFPLSLKEIKKFISSLKTYPGHNPVASWIYVMIWVCVLLLGISGFMMGLDTFWGEEWLEKIHDQLSQILSILVIVHFIGLIFDSIKNKRKTWLGMITGRR